MILSSEFSKNFEVAFHTGKDLPTDLRELRKRIYSDEMGYLTNETLFNSWDDLGVHIMIRNKATGKSVASAHAYPAIKGEIAEYSGMTTSQLKSGVVITRVMVDDSMRGHGLIKVLLYLCCRQGRLWNKNRIFCFSKKGEKPTFNVLQYQWLDHLKTRSFTGADGKNHEFHAITQRLDIGLTRSWKMMPDPWKQMLVKQNVLSDEVVETTKKRIEIFFQNNFFKTIYSQTLTKDHYIWTLSNFYQFVRFTTRILAKAASLSEESKLRKHFIGHMDGEIDHEVQLEVDLSTLGADVNYVREDMLPSKPIQKFTSIQESLLGYRLDPISYMAVPFGIEGFAAHLDGHFVEALEKNISRWGVKNPSRATTFLRAHILSDGGPDGHWEQNKKSITRFVDTEEKLGKFLNVLHITFDSMEEIYADFVAEPDLSYLRSSEEEARKTA